MRAEPFDPRADRAYFRGRLAVHERRRADGSMTEGEFAAAAAFLAAAMAYADELCAEEGAEP